MPTYSILILDNFNSLVGREYFVSKGMDWGLGYILVHTASRPLVTVQSVCDSGDLGKVHGLIIRMG